MLDPKSLLQKREHDCFIVLNELYTIVEGKTNHWVHLDELASKHEILGDHFSEIYKKLKETNLIKPYGARYTSFITHDGINWLANYDQKKKGANNEVNSQTIVHANNYVHNQGVIQNIAQDSSIKAEEGADKSTLYDKILRYLKNNKIVVFLFLAVLFISSVTTVKENLLNLFRNEPSKEVISTVKNDSIKEKQIDSTQKQRTNTEQNIGDNRITKSKKQINTTTEKKENVDANNHTHPLSKSDIAKSVTRPALTYKHISITKDNDSSQYLIGDFLYEKRKFDTKTDGDMVLNRITNLKKMDVTNGVDYVSVSITPTSNGHRYAQGLLEFLKENKVPYKVEPFITSFGQIEYDSVSISLLYPAMSLRIGKFK